MAISTSLRCQRIPNFCGVAGMSSLSLGFAAGLTLFLKSSLNGNPQSEWLQRGFPSELPGVKELVPREQFQGPPAVLS